MSNFRFIFDLETTGLPKRERGKRLDYKKLLSFKECRIVSISWILMYDTGIEDIEKNIILEKKLFYVKPDNFTISKKSIEIHKLTPDFLDENGVPIDVVINELINKFNEYNIIEMISHNTDFDMSVLKSELFRYNHLEFLDKINKINIYCTMLNSQKKMNVSKWPKLSEAYKFFYNKEITNAHQAEFDTLYCYQIYKALSSY
jgi:DNA polymerase III subunit epsilon